MLSSTQLGVFSSVSIVIKINRTAERYRTGYWKEPKNVQKLNESIEQRKLIEFESLIEEVKKIRKDVYKYHLSDLEDYSFRNEIATLKILWYNDFEVMVFQLKLTYEENEKRVNENSIDGEYKAYWFLNGKKKN